MLFLVRFITKARYRAELGRDGKTGPVSTRTDLNIQLRTGKKQDFASFPTSALAVTNYPALSGDLGAISHQLSKAVQARGLTMNHVFL